MKKLIKKLYYLVNTRFLVNHLQHNFIVNEVSNKKFENVVDIGAGKSPYKKFINFQRYIGIDVEDRQKLGAVIIADINKGVPIDSNTSDLVLLIEVLEHLKEPGYVLKEICRILKPGGKLILTTPLVWPIHEAPNDYFRYTNYGLEYLLKNAGFTDIKIIPSNKNIYTLFQIFNINLRPKIFIPFVLVFNFFGYLLKNFGNNNLPLVNQVVVYKNINK